MPSYFTVSRQSGLQSVPDPTAPDASPPPAVKPDDLLAAFIKVDDLVSGQTYRKVTIHTRKASPVRTGVALTVDHGCLDYVLDLRGGYNSADPINYGSTLEFSPDNVRTDASDAFELFQSFEASVIWIPSAVTFNAPTVLKLHRIPADERRNPVDSTFQTRMNNRQTPPHSLIEFIADSSGVQKIRMYLPHTGRLESAWYIALALDPSTAGDDLRDVLPLMEAVRVVRVIPKPSTVGVVDDGGPGRQLHNGWHTVYSDAQETKLVWAIYVDTNNPANEYWYQAAGAGIGAYAGSPLYYHYSTSGSSSLTKSLYAPTDVPTSFDSTLACYYSVWDTNAVTTVAVIGQDQPNNPTVQKWWWHGTSVGQILDTAQDDTLKFISITAPAASTLVNTTWGTANVKQVNFAVTLY